MSLSDEIVQKVDASRRIIQEVLKELDPDNYQKSYDKVWLARSDMELIVILTKLLNNLEEDKADKKWKQEFAEGLKRPRAEHKVREAFKETLELYEQLEEVDDVKTFYQICWMLKEKITILLDIVKPKFRRQKKVANEKGEKSKDNFRKYSENRSLEKDK